MIVIGEEITVNKWWIVYNEDKSITHYGMTKPSQVTETGLSLFQVFNSEIEWLNVLQTEFNITQ